MAAFIVNDRNYNPPGRPVVGICLDGSADEYFDAALARGLMPNLPSMSVSGYRGLASGQMPSFIMAVQCALFQLGRVVITPNALDQLTPADIRTNGTGWVWRNCRTNRCTK